MGIRPKYCGQEVSSLKHEAIAVKMQALLLLFQGH
jgi:hypothetical protein